MVAAAVIAVVVHGFTFGIFNLNIQYTGKQQSCSHELSPIGGSFLPSGCHGDSGGTRQAAQHHLHPEWWRRVGGPLGQQQIHGHPEPDPDGSTRVVMNQSYTLQACSPTRSALLTGRLVMWWISHPVYWHTQRCLTRRLVMWWILHPVYWHTQGCWQEGGLCDEYHILYTETLSIVDRKVGYVINITSSILTHSALVTGRLIMW